MYHRLFGRRVSVVSYFRSGVRACIYDDYVHVKRNDTDVPLNSCRPKLSDGASVLIDEALLKERRYFRFEAESSSIHRSTSTSTSASSERRLAGAFSFNGGVHVRTTTTCTLSAMARPSPLNSRRPKNEKAPHIVVSQRKSITHRPYGDIVYDV